MQWHQSRWLSIRSFLDILAQFEGNSDIFGDIYVRRT